MDFCVYNENGDLDIIMYYINILSHVIRVKRLKWAGHLMRLEHRVPKMVFSGDFGGGRPAGKPHIR